MLLPFFSLPVLAGCGESARQGPAEIPTYNDQGAGRPGTLSVIPDRSAVMSPLPVTRPGGGRHSTAQHHHRHRQLRPAGDNRGRVSGARVRADRRRFRRQHQRVFSVVLTSTGKVLIPAQANTSTWDDGLLALGAHINDPCGAENSCDITLKDSLGSSVTMILPPAKY
jgi:hypothetical protein